MSWPRASPTSDPVLQTTIPAATQDELEFPYLPQNMDIDVPSNCWGSLSITGDTSQDTARDHLEALTNSAMEAKIWEDLTNTPSLSTTTSLQYANQSRHRHYHDQRSAGQIDTSLGRHGVESQTRLTCEQDATATTADRHSRS